MLDACDTHLRILQPYDLDWFGEGSLCCVYLDDAQHSRAELIYEAKGSSWATCRMMVAGDE